MPLPSLASLKRRALTEIKPVVTPENLLKLTQEYAEVASPTEVSALAEYIAQCFAASRARRARECKDVMFLSPHGLAFIKAHEGLRLKAYKDIGGTLTIGYGSTTNVREGQVISEARATQLLADDLVRFEKVVNETIFGVPVSQSQYDALVSLAFNIGTEAFRKSTLAKKLKAKDYDGAASQFMSWIYVKKKQNAVLYRRRFEERELFLRKPVESQTLADA